MNRFSNVQGTAPDYGHFITPKGGKPIRQVVVSTPRFDGCDDLELSNFSSLDSNVKNMVSKERFDYNFSGVKTNLASPKSAPRLDYNADGEDSKNEDVKPEIAAIKADSNISTERKILGMKPKVAYGVGAAILIAAGTFVYFKYIKK